MEKNKTDVDYGQGERIVRSPGKVKFQSRWWSHEALTGLIGQSIWVTTQGWDLVVWIYPVIWEGKWRCGHELICEIKNCDEI